MKLFSILTVIVLSVSACTTTPTVVYKQAEFHVSQSLLTKCPDLPTIGDGTKTTVTMGDLVTYNKNLSQQYIDCATKDDSLIDIVTPNVTQTQK
jgi:hypothetical protein